MPLQLDVERVEPPRLLSFRWSPQAFFNPDLEVVATSLVVIEIEPDPRGSQLTVTESCFDGIHSELLDNVIQANAGGWSTQVLQLELFLSGAIDVPARQGLRSRATMGEEAPTTRKRHGDAA